MDTTRLIETKKGQVVLMPEKYRLPGDEVYIERVGDTIVLRPKYHGPVDEPRTLIPDALVQDITEAGIGPVSSSQTHAGKDSASTTNIE